MPVEGDKFHFTGDAFKLYFGDLNQSRLAPVILCIYRFNHR